MQAYIACKMDRLTIGHLRCQTLVLCAMFTRLESEGPRKVTMMHKNVPRRLYCSNVECKPHMVQQIGGFQRGCAHAVRPNRMSEDYNQILCCSQ